MLTIVKQHGISQIYLLAAILSAKGEQHPRRAWNVNMRGLFNVLEIAKDESLDRVYFPSSIAVFGDHIPKDLTPQYAPLFPKTVYGISKVAGEHWCNYYYSKYGIDVRSLRYPGIIGHRSMPGGGTTDYAVDIYHSAIQHKKFHCFLKDDTKLPMMYMEDAIDATLQIMDAPKEDIKIRNAYNLSGISFSPAEIAGEPLKRISRIL